MGIGQNINRIRKGQGLTIKDVALMADVTPSLVSQIENDKANPSLSTLMSLAKALNVNVTSFFEQGSTQKVDSPVTRLGDRPQLASYGKWNTHLLTNRNYEYFSLNYSILEPGADSDEYPEMHAGHQHGYEFGYVLIGKIQVELGEEIYILNPGDSICFDAEARHRVLNLSSARSEVIWETIYTPEGH